MWIQFLCYRELLSTFSCMGNPIRLWLIMSLKRAKYGQYISSFVDYTTHTKHSVIQTYFAVTSGSNAQS